MKKYYSTDSLLLSLQRSLLGYIRPDLRAVLLKNSNTEITITFILDHDPSIEDEDFYSESLLDFVSDFPINASIKINERFIYSTNSSSVLVEKDEIFVFLRYET